MINFAVVVVVVAPLLIAQSQPPASAPTKATQEKWNITDKKDGLAGIDKATTSRAPSAIPKSVPLQPQGISQNSAQYESERSTPNWLALILTAAIAGAAWVQVRVYRKQTTLMKSALQETAKAAEAARVGAEAAREHVNTSKAAMDAAVASAAESAKIATDALNSMRQQSAAQERFADATERLVDATENLAKTISCIDVHSG